MGCECVGWWAPLRLVHIPFASAHARFVGGWGGTPGRRTVHTPLASLAPLSFDERGDTWLDWVYDQ